MNTSFCSSVSDCGLPCRPLWIALVTSKNSSRPWITRHSASMPTSFSSGIRVYWISATPPPKAVADRCSMRLPRSGSASVRISSASDRPTIDA